MRYHPITFLVAAAMLAACASPNNTTGSQQARLRNSMPVSCTTDQQKACPVPEIVACPDDQEPVLDYSSDCCVHFSCQPRCQSAVACPMTPAPLCPKDTKLWIGTALEDCCPAYRCLPTCDSASGACCDPTTVACNDVMPYCGPGIDPVVVEGHTADCCPIYQCPCDTTSDAGSVPSCGCTYPNCKAGEQLVCTGANICGYPCTCEPAPGTCTSKSDCPSGQKCEIVCTASGCTAGNADGGTCACPATDPTCTCDSTGNCTGPCVGHCVPECDPSNPPTVCPLAVIACPNNVEPVLAGTDPTTCCPIYECPVCTPTSSSTPVVCPMVRCACSKQTGIDPKTCCPTYECGSTNTDGSCK